MSTHRDRAVVVGASVSGLLIGRVLADHFKEVLLIDKEPLDRGVAARKAVPQGNHIHGILSPMVMALESLLPGFVDDLSAAGANIFDSGAGTRFHIYGTQLKNGHTDQPLIGCTRPFFEHHLRQRVMSLPNLEIRPHQRHERWLTSEDQSEILGLEMSGPAGNETLYADLMVAARGRASALRKELLDFGFDAARQEVVSIDLGYTSRLFELTGHKPAWDLLIVNQSPPQVWINAVIQKVEHDRFIGTQVGYFGDHAPCDDEGYLEFAKRLPVQAFADFLHIAKPVSDYHRFGTRDSRMTRFEEMSRFPGNLLVVGDAVCSLNPVYGQGMTKAANEAMHLNSSLAMHLETNGSLAGFSDVFRKSLPDVGADWAWQMTTSADLQFDQTVGDRSNSSTIMNWYMKRLFVKATRNVEVRKAIFDATMLAKPPQSLTSLRMMLHAIS